mmetsp:Transcript_27811/g.62888  ORF Transcript_27811/g.62888 Transcript_27811/m.62888 type:complete len:273 (-) Transcript_27811:10-828(-)
MVTSWWCVHNDPCGICCVCVTYGLLCFADYVVVYVLLQPWMGLTANCYMVALSFLTISFLAMSSHMRTMLTDPGAVPIEYQPSHLMADQGGSLPMCSRCNGYKPLRAHHCSQCDRCIMKMDHHCPWVNNCVGANNQKHFVLFVGYTALLSSYAIVLLVVRMISNASEIRPAGARHSPPDPSHFLLLALLFFESVLFGLFTLAMFTEQISSILADQTGIERLKHDYVAPKRSALTNLSETFGKPFSLLWFLPTAVKFNGLTWLELMPVEPLDV